MANRSPGGQLTSKTGMKSLSQKMDGTRHAFDRHPASSKTEGAFGREEIHNSARDSTTGTTRRGKKASLGRMKNSK